MYQTISPHLIYHKETFRFLGLRFSSYLTNQDQQQQSISKNKNYIYTYFIRRMKQKKKVIWNSKEYLGWQGNKSSSSRNRKLWNCSLSFLTCDSIITIYFVYWYPFLTKSFLIKWNWRIIGKFFSVLSLHLDVLVWKQLLILTTTPIKNNYPQSHYKFTSIENQFKKSH